MDSRTQLVDALVRSLEVPDSAYELAEKRYRDLGEWLHDRSQAQCAAHAPSVFPQGSFRLGTAIKPLEGDDYDLDLACNLESGITKASHSQEDLKRLVGADIERYRKARGIQQGLEEKHRCWRLNYRDNIQFHLDIVPCMPQSADVMQLLEGLMCAERLDPVLAGRLAHLAVAITDDRKPNYRSRSQEWPISNPEGYAQWFESRMNLARQLLEQRAMAERVASIAALPAYRWKSPLQRSVQILKRHRDMMFKNSPDRKPISIIITTLAARAYNGETDISQALESILNTMGTHVNSTLPRVPNPVNRSEDFADKWYAEAGRQLRLEENFWSWLEQAKADFLNLVDPKHHTTLSELGLQKYGVLFDSHTLGTMPRSTLSAVAVPTYRISESPPAKPWSI
jgi:hypothetical protein